MLPAYMGILASYEGTMADVLAESKFAWMRDTSPPRWRTALWIWCGEGGGPEGTYNMTMNQINAQKYGYNDRMAWMVTL